MELQRAQGVTQHCSRCFGRETLFPAWASNVECQLGLPVVGVETMQENRPYDRWLGAPPHGPSEKLCSDEPGDKFATVLQRLVLRPEDMASHLGVRGEGEDILCIFRAQRSQ